MRLRSVPVAAQFRKCPRAAIARKQFSVRPTATTPFLLLLLFLGLLLLLLLLATCPAAAVGGTVVAAGDAVVSDGYWWSLRVEDCCIICLSGVFLGISFSRHATNRMRISS